MTTTPPEPQIGRKSRISAADGEGFEVQAYLDDPANVSTLLQRARDRVGHVWCCCASPPRPLVIRRVRAVLYLAVWPGDGAKHDFQCAFYRPPPLLASAAEIPTPALPAPPLELVASGQPKSVSPAAAPNDAGAASMDGDLAEAEQVTLGFALSLPAKAPRARSGKDGGLRHGSAGPAPVAASEPLLPPTGHDLADLLQLLWERGRLNCWWRGWRRDWWRVRRELMLAAQQLAVGPELLTDVLHVPMPPGSDASATEQSDRWVQFEGRLQGAGVNKDTALGLVLDEVTLVEQSKFGWRITLANLPKRIYMTAAQHQALAAHQSRALGAIGRTHPHPNRVIVLALVGLNKDGRYMNLVDAALMLCSQAWVPAATGYEVALANALVDEGRGFERAAAAARDEVDLGYVLRDAQRPVALEILGLDVPGYLKRRRAHFDRLRQAGYDVWVWDAASGQGMPALPPPRRQRPISAARRSLVGAI